MTDLRAGGETPAIPSSRAVEPQSGGAPTATLLIATYNRAPFLRETLQSLVSLESPAGITWDVLVVDNNSTDDTRDLVRSAAQSFPVPLRYIFEARQGKSIALNTAIADISSALILFSDDDVRVPARWLRVAVEALRERGDIDYVGGPVKPMWGGPKPRWLEEAGASAGVLAVLDYGSDAFVFEDRALIPLGVNMAVKRSLIERIGGFHPRLGRSGGSLLGQEQAEFFIRCRRAGGRGLYVPEMWLEHLVPADRLSLRYFLRWWFWKGVSHGRWYRMHNETELGVDLRRVSRLFGMPRFLYGSAVRDAAGLLRALVTGRVREAVDRLFQLAYFLGHCREGWFGPKDILAEVEAPAPGSLEAARPPPHSR